MDVITYTCYLDACCPASLGLIPKCPSKKVVNERCEACIVENRNG